MTNKYQSFAPSTYANVGSFDRLARFGLGMVLIVAGLVAQEPIGANSAMFLLSIPLVITAIIAWDPFYVALKIRTATLHASSELSYETDANEGPLMSWLDRIGRFGLGSVLLSVTLLSVGPVEWVVTAALISIPVIMTGVMGWDPLYALLGIRTAILPITTAVPYTYEDEVKVFDLYDEAPQRDHKKAA